MRGVIDERRTNHLGARTEPLVVQGINDLKRVTVNATIVLKTYLEDVY